MNKSKVKCLECGNERSDESSDYENIQKTSVCIDCERDFIEFLGEVENE